MDTTTTAAAPTAVPAPTPQHHANLFLYLQIFAGLLPVITAPFLGVNHAKAQGVIATESDIASKVLAALHPQS